MHTHRHPQTFWQRRLVSHRSSFRAASHVNSTKPLAGAGQALPWLPPSPARSCHPLPGAGSSRVCRYHHNKSGGDGARDKMLAGKFPLSSVCSGWLTLQSTAVYSPYKNIYIETACSYAYKANAFRLGQAPTPYSGTGNNRLPSEPSTSKAGQKPASISENLSKSYIWILEPSLGSP